MFLQTDDAAKRIPFTFDADNSPQAMIHELLKVADARGLGGPVAMHLIGARLAVSFPTSSIGTLPYVEPSDRCEREADFFVGTTAFHVTTSLHMTLVRRCKANLGEGLLCYLLVPTEMLSAARALLKSQELDRRVTSDSVESFLGQSVSFSAQFAPANHAQEFSALLAEYNRRVSDIEMDPALLINVPRLLTGPEI